jgi:hydroxymethylpyrimidine/phosphomethylpyrimidine kinase
MADIISLLTSTHKPLKDIAHRLGFSSQAQLSRFFKKHRGISPTEFQQGQSKN